LFRADRAKRHCAESIDPSRDGYGQLLNHVDVSPPWFKRVADARSERAAHCSLSNVFRTLQSGFAAVRLKMVEVGVFRRTPCLIELDLARGPESSA
jgi:hypothetical protein